VPPPASPSLTRLAPARSAARSRRWRSRNSASVASLIFPASTSGFSQALPGGALAQDGLLQGRLADDVGVGQQPPEKEAALHPAREPALDAQRALPLRRRDHALPHENLAQQPAGLHLLGERALQLRGGHRSGVEQDAAQPRRHHLHHLDAALPQVFLDGDHRRRLRRVKQAHFHQQLADPAVGADLQRECLVDPCTRHQPGAHQEFAQTRNVKLHHVELRSSA